MPIRKTTYPALLILDFLLYSTETWILSEYKILSCFAKLFRVRKIAQCKQLAWKKIAEKNTISSNSGSEFDIDGKKIAIFNQNGYHALDAICVHQDNPITAGKLDGDIVECPSHFWHYNIKTGELQDYLKGVKLQTYPVEERADGIYIDLQQ